MQGWHDQLQKFDPGVVMLDADNRISAMNDVALRLLGDLRGAPIGRQVLQRSAAIADRALLIKLTRLHGRGAPIGACLVFYDLTEFSTPGDAPAATGEHEPAGRPRLLVKIPVLTHNRVLLLGVDDVVWMQSEGHYTTVYTRDQQYFCNLSLAEFEERLDHERFLRTHRSHFVNLQRVQAIERDNAACLVVMEGRNSPRVPVSRSRVPALKAALGLSRRPPAADEFPGPPRQRDKSRPTLRGPKGEGGGWA